MPEEGYDAVSGEGSRRPPESQRKPTDSLAEIVNLEEGGAH